MKRISRDFIGVYLNVVLHIIYHYSITHYTLIKLHTQLIITLNKILALCLEIKHVGAAIDVQQVHVVLLNDGRNVRKAKIPLTEISIPTYIENQYLK